MILIPFLLFLLNSIQLESSKFFNVDLSNQTKKCLTWLQTHTFENNELHRERGNSIGINFNDYKQLTDIDCFNLTLNTNMLLLNAERKLLIEDNINLDSILKLINFTNTNKDMHEIQIRNTLGFNQYFNHSKSLQIDMSKYAIYFIDVNFDFYLNKSLITKDMCRHEMFYKKQINYFWPMRTLFFDDVSYSSSSPICPYVFLNSILYNLGLYQIANSFIFKNRLEFMQIDADVPSGGLSTTHLEFLELSLVFEELNEKILYPPIFKHIKGLQIAGSPYRIKENLFEPFTQLEYVICIMDNLKYLLHQGIEWMMSLNVNANLNIVIIILKEINVNHWQQVYMYPNEDLCLFKTFPHKQLVIPSIIMSTADTIPCTCTLIWLIQNQPLIDKSYLNNSSVNVCLKNFTAQFETCKFREKFSTCSNTSMAVKFVVDKFFFYQWLKLIVQVYAKTFLTSLGLITNLLIMLTLKNKKHKKTLDNVMYEHIFFNSMFNFMYCFIHLFSLFNLCIFSKSSFCSSVYKTQVVQYFKIIFILFLGNSLLLCSNFSFILFSVSRVCNLTSTKSKLFHKLKSLNLNLFYLIMFVMCSFWSMFKLFEYRPNEAFSTFDTSFPYNRYDFRYCQYTNVYYRFLLSGCKIFPILNMINNVLNNILFLFISIFIDICMIRFANQNYQKKRELNVDLKHLEEALMRMKKIKKLIITNGILFFFSHVPQFLSNILVIVFSDDLNTSCFTSFSCTGILEIVETFAFLSIGMQFFVYNHFDNNFIESKKDLFKRFFRKFK